jgi:serine protease Do
MRSSHDLALLKIKGSALPALNIGDSKTVREGDTVAFTGFPIGTVLGLYPVTHKATVSSITPIVIPKTTSKDLDTRVLNRLKNPFEVFQLDGTAYPGNSGSPLYNPDSATVIGVLNMVFVKETKENALEDPSGISYAIPASYVTELMNRAGVKR